MKIARPRSGKLMCRRGKLMMASSFEPSDYMAFSPSPAALLLPERHVQYSCSIIIFQQRENNLVRCDCRLVGGTANVMRASTSTTKRIIFLQHSKLATTMRTTRNCTCQSSDSSVSMGCNNHLTCIRNTSSRWTIPPNLGCQPDTRTTRLLTVFDA